MPNLRAVGAVSSRLRTLLPGGRHRRVAGVPQLFDPGHFYSPVVNAAELLRPAEAERVWPADPREPPGIDLRADAQLALLDRLAGHRFDHAAPRPGPAYEPGNGQFPRQDAAVLYAMVHHLRPRRIVEVGSGWSTTVAMAAIHDAGLATDVTCVEPHPPPYVRELAGRVTLREERVEHTPVEVFERLGTGDICFIDSSHVAKTGSDVVHLLLDVVPRLADGVAVHVHDIFLPEDYPRPWIEAGFNWNEQYLLQALLVGNRSLHVLLLNHWLALRHPDAVRDAFDLDRLHGSSAWLMTGPPPEPS